MNDADLIAAAHDAAKHSYSPYSGFAVGAALLFDDGTDDGAVITGTNIENASYGLTFCAESVAAAKAMADGMRGGLIKVAVVGPASGGGDMPTTPITPCGRCRQVLFELAALGATDPEILCVGPDEVRRVRLSVLLPDAFGPDSLV